MTEIEKLSKIYKTQLKCISETSKLIKKELHSIYTEDKIKEFETFDMFLEDINYICEEGGTGKLLFIKFIETEYFSNIV